MAEAAVSLEKPPTEAHFRDRNQPVTVLTGEGATFDLGAALESGEADRAYLEGINGEAGKFIAVFYPGERSSTIYYDIPGGFVRRIHAGKDSSGQGLKDKPLVLGPQTEDTEHYGQPDRPVVFERLSVYGQSMPEASLPIKAILENPRLKFRRLSKLATISLPLRKFKPARRR